MSKGLDQLVNSFEFVQITNFEPEYLLLLSITLPLVTRMLPLPHIVLRFNGFVLRVSIINECKNISKGAIIK